METPRYHHLARAAAAAAVRKRHVIKLTTLALWSVAIGSATVSAAVHPGVSSRLVVSSLLLLVGLAHIHSALMAWRQAWDKRQMLGLLRGKGYLSEVRRLPDVAAFASQLGQQLEGSRRSGEPCTLVLARVAARQVVGDGCAESHATEAVAELARSLVRAQRGADILGYLGDGAFATLLADCSREEASQFVRRLPAALPAETSDGRRHALEVALNVVEYDGLPVDPMEFLLRAGAGTVSEPGRLDFSFAGS